MATGFRNPAVFAKQALTIDHISDGRLDLALGAGWAEIDHSMTGLEMWPPPERLRRFREALTIVDRLLRGEVVTYEGRYYRVHEATLDAEPVQPGLVERVAREMLPALHAPAAARQ